MLLVGVNVCVFDKREIKKMGFVVVLYGRQAPGVSQLTVILSENPVSRLVFTLTGGAIKTNVFPLWFEVGGCNKWGGWDLNMFVVGR